MRIDHAFFALMKVDSTRALWLVRLFAENLIVRSVRKIIKSDSAVSVDHSLCVTRLSLFWSANQLFHLIYQTDRLWRNENRSKIEFICSVFDSIALWTWSILNFYDQLTSWLKHQIRIFIVQSSVQSSAILCCISHSCIRSKRDSLKRMLRSEVHHSFSSETKFLRIRSLKNHSLCKFAFLNRNVSRDVAIHNTEDCGNRVLMIERSQR
jgi:hypothetical protein